MPTKPIFRLFFDQKKRSFYFHINKTLLWQSSLYKEAFFVVIKTQPSALNPTVNKGQTMFNPQDTPNLLFRLFNFPLKDTTLHTTKTHYTWLHLYSTYSYQTKAITLDYTIEDLYEDLKTNYKPPNPNPQTILAHTIATHLKAQLGANHTINLINPQVTIKITKENRLNIQLIAIHPDKLNAILQATQPTQ